MIFVPVPRAFAWVPRGVGKTGATFSGRLLRAIAEPRVHNRLEADAQRRTKAMCAQIHGFGLPFEDQHKGR
jgi:hypothetical protein